MKEVRVVMGEARGADTPGGTLLDVRVHHICLEAEGGIVRTMDSVSAFVSNEL